MDLSSDLPFLASHEQLTYLQYCELEDYIKLHRKRLINELKKMDQSEINATKNHNILLTYGLILEEDCYGDDIINKYFVIYTISHELGNHYATIKLGNMYVRGGMTCHYDVKKGYDLLLSIEKMGNTEAMFVIGQLELESCSTVDKTYGLELLQNSAKLGNRKSMYMLGSYYVEGEYVSMNKERGIKLIKGSAEMNYTDAFVYLASLSEKINKNETIELLKNGAERGCIKCINNLAIKYSNDNKKYDKYENKKLALELFVSIAPYSITASRNAGLMYFKGEGCERDYTKAMELFEKPAQHGCEMSMYDMGLFWLRGYGCDVNIDKAVEWFDKVEDELVIHLIVKAIDSSHMKNKNMGNLVLNLVLMFLDDNRKSFINFHKLFWLLTEHINIHCDDIKYVDDICEELIYNDEYLKYPRIPRLLIMFMFNEPGKSYLLNSKHCIRFLEIAKNSEMFNGFKFAEPILCKLREKVSHEVSHICKDMLNSDVIETILDY